ncbi:amino acid permease [Desulfurobacterium atlanticum]|uniref:Transporter, cation-chloride cotransporter (CCC) family n=1 Tax=Desulfurobacterium atlanticum TaxID=240169 RepID=A0A238ZUD9_9BACT|nr:amino acid permease [Desulfurobacterium atlanticum]SNR86970.1 transporter, cation-chloride cotransporter (CCC) family [Desulfurobacterium atlanticum]
MAENIRRFNTFSGVFVPTLLSIFGVILFLRTGWVIGNTGLMEGIILITLAMSISFATGLSLSSISTNKEVGIGGVYYIISRSLGLDIGGTVGIPLFISQAISVAFYLIGFAESLRGIFPNVPIFTVATAVLILFTIIAYIGADFVVKLQIGIFAALLLGIFSFLLNPHFTLIAENLAPHYLPGENLWSVFAVFFPAVTGVTAGIAMSGELKNPKRAIPLGIISALTVSYLTYLLIAYKLSATAPYTTLQKDTLVMVHNSVFPPLVYVGIWMATLSSALTFIIGAPRTLQALAVDGIVPQIFAATLGSKKNEPRAGILITYAIAQGSLLLGSLNVVAAVITMFFLITYAVTNLAAALYSLLNPPTYRPSFKIPWFISFYGVAGSYIVMFLINSLATVVATAILVLLYLFLRKKHLQQAWGDIKTGILISIAKFCLLKLTEKKQDPKDWRPNVLVFCGAPDERPYLTEFAKFLSFNDGIITLANIITTTSDEKITLLKEKEIEKLFSHIKKHKLDFFPKVIVERNLENTFSRIAQYYGFGRVEANTVLFGWGKSRKNQIKLIKDIKNLLKFKKDVLILNYNNLKGWGKREKIDIWWGGKGGNFALMTFIAHTLADSPEWKKSGIRVMKVVNSEKELNIFKTAYSNLLKAARLDAEVVIVPNFSGKDFKELIKEHSLNADLIILGLSIPKEKEEEKTADRITYLSEDMPTTLFVRSMTPKDIWDIG